MDKDKLKYNDELNKLKKEKKIIDINQTKINYFKDKDISFALSSISIFCNKLMTNVKEKIFLSEIDKSLLIFHPKLIETKIYTETDIINELELIMNH